MTVQQLLILRASEQLLWDETQLYHSSFMFENKDELLVQDNLGSRPALTDGRLVAGALQFHKIPGLYIE